MTGRALAEAFYAEVVSRVVGRTPHGAGLLGWGSDVLGYDTLRSADHGWGPRLQVFVSAENVDGVVSRVNQGLPEEFRGHPVRFGWDDTPVSHHVEVSTLQDWVSLRLGFDPRDHLSTTDWLVTPQQLLLGVTAGPVFHDDLGELAAVRSLLTWYPDQVWLWLLACQWQRISQEEAFVGRAAEVGDDLGSAVVAARLVRELIRLGLLFERQYAPYSKWLGTAFSQLELAKTMKPPLQRALGGKTYEERESGLVEAYEVLAGRHNALGITKPVDPNTRDYHGRPYRVLHASRFVAACRDEIKDGSLSELPLVGSVDQFVDSTDLLQSPDRVRRLAVLFDERRR